MGIKENLDIIEEKITRACASRGRERSEVTLVAVSKNNPVEKIKEAYDCGVRVFGENRVQELISKIDLLPDDIEWHMIGNLQRNKVKYIVGRVSLIHSVDSLKLASEISKEAVKRGCVQDILLEVNIAGEESKHGVSPEKVADLVRDISILPGLRLKGLMTMAPFVMDGEENRPYFVKLRQLSVDITKKNIDNTNIINKIDLKILSMGMSGDFKPAIEEGANLVRIGTSVFG